MPAEGRKEGNPYKQPLKPQNAAERHTEAINGILQKMNTTELYFIGYKAGYEAQKAAGQSADEYKRAFDAGYSDAKDNREPDISEGRRQKDAR
jgi:hypothetical protein